MAKYRCCGSTVGEYNVTRNKTSELNSVYPLTLYLQRDAVSAAARRRGLRRLRGPGRLGPLARDKNLLALEDPQGDVVIVVLGVLVAVERVEVGREVQAVRTPRDGGVMVDAPRVMPVRAPYRRWRVFGPGGRRAREGRQAEEEHYRGPEERSVGHDERRR